MKAPTLHPTLWRTCRVLAGPIRLQLLRQVIDSPGTCVSRLAEQAGIGISLASQELRRLQSRGLLRQERSGAFVHYFPTPDPQVPSAKPLLSALSASFARFPPAADSTLRQLASGLSHPHRIVLFRELLAGPQTARLLADRLRIPARTVYRHLLELERNQWARRHRGVFQACRRSHPLAKCLEELVCRAPPPPH